MTTGNALKVVEEVDLPLSVEEAWRMLADTPLMVALDPLIESYQPQRGTIEAGTINRVTTRYGPIRTTTTSRTELLEPPHRAVFVSVAPSHPVRVRTEDTLETTRGGCRYRVSITLTPTVPLLGRAAARVLAAAIARSRRQLMQRLRVTAAAASASTSTSWDRTEADEQRRRADRNRQTMLGFYHACNRRDLDALGACFADDVVSNVTEELGLGQGREAMLRYLRTSFAALPDARIEVLEAIAEGEVVAVRYRGVGTHQGEFMGIPATGHTLDLEVGAFGRCDDDGRIVEYLAYADNLSALQQLGVLGEDPAK